jgi:hypothetical protein
VCDGYDAAGKPAKYIYLYGASGADVGKAVTYDEAGVVAVLAANAKGPVAWSTSAFTATTEAGWYQIGSFGGMTVDAAATSGDNATIGRETTDGLIGDGRAAGDEIIGAFSRGASAGGAQLIQVVDGPQVNDFQGA